MNFKNIFSLSVIAMTLVVLSSCSEDDGPSPVIDETNLVGTWLFHSLDAGDDATSALWIKELGAKGARLAFKRDRTYFGVGYLDPDPGTWRFENNTLTFDKGTKDEESWEVLELSPTTLVLHAPGGTNSGGKTFPAATLTFSNVSKDDPIPLIDKTNLVGTWLFESGDVAGDPTATALLQLEFAGAQWTLKSDGTSIFTFQGEDEIRSTWTLENNTIIEDIDTEDEAILEVRELSPTTLVAHTLGGANSDGFFVPTRTFTFQRVQ